jgi:hypothetical protein
MNINLFSQLMQCGSGLAGIFAYLKMCASSLYYFGVYIIYEISYFQILLTIFFAISCHAKNRGFISSYIGFIDSSLLGHI